LFSVFVEILNCGELGDGVTWQPVVGSDLVVAGSRRWTIYWTTVCPADYVEAAASCYKTDNGSSPGWQCPTFDGGCLRLTLH